MNPIQVGDVIQISPTVQDWGGVFAVVSEVKSWGVQCYVSIPFQPGLAYYRVEFKDFVSIGKAAWLDESIKQDRRG